MKELIAMLMGKAEKGRDANRLIQLAALIYLITEFNTVKADVAFLKEHRCRCGQSQPAASIIGTNTVTLAKHES